MTGLRLLHIFCRVDPPALLRSINCSLEAFSYDFPMCDEVSAFLHSQPTILVLGLYQFFGRHRYPPEVGFLPHLRALQARPSDIPRLINGRPVFSIKFQYRPADRILQPHFRLECFNLSTRLIRHVELMACQLADEADLEPLFSRLKRLLITEDSSWAEARVATASSPCPLISRMH